MGEFGGSSSPWVYRETPEDIRAGGSPFAGLPLDIVAQVGQDGISGIQYYFNHFYQWEGPTAAGAAGGWLASKVDGGSDDAEVIGVNATAQFGVLEMRTNDADDDNVQLALKGGGFRYIPGKRLWCLGRFALPVVANGEFAFGLAKPDTDWFSTLPTNGIFFEKGPAATDMDLHVRGAGTSTEKTAVFGATLAGAVFFTAGFVVDPVGNVVPYYNGQARAASVVPYTDTNFPASSIELELTMQIQTASIIPGVVLCDWLLVAQER